MKTFANFKNYTLKKIAQEIWSFSSSISVLLVTFSDELFAKTEIGIRVKSGFLPPIQFVSKFILSVTFIF
jgi:hypothetical protein